jgi:flagellar hook-associated protein 2
MAVSTMVEIQDTISKIIQYEREPLTKLEQDKAGLQRKNTAWSEIDSSLESLQAKLEALKSESTFLGKTVSSTDTGVATASASVDSIQATYQIDVQQLAQVAKITSSGSLGLSEASYAVLQSSEEINASGGASVTVNPNVSFASGSAAIGLDLDKTVVSGSFSINDIEISVTGSDTIYTILSKINSSSAGVTATFDEDTDKIVLTSTTGGSGESITLDDDTSGFLDAMKLTATNGNPAQDFTDGEDAGLYRALDETVLTQGTNAVQDGYFMINNITFKVDVDQDSLQSILNRINNSSAGVTAYLDDVTGKLTLSSKTTGEDIYLQNDTSNFLKKLQLMDRSADLDGTTGKAHYQGTQAQVMVNGELLYRDGNTFTLGGTSITVNTLGDATISVNQDEEKAVSAVRDFVNQFNNSMTLIDTNLRSTLKNDRTLMNLKREMQRKFFSDVSNSGTFRSLGQVGISFVSTGGYGLGRLKFTQADFREALRSKSEDVMKLFADDTDDDGIYDDGGIANIAKTYLDHYTKSTDGVFTSKVDSNSKRATYYDKRIEKEQEKLDKREKDLLAEFQKLNSAISSMESQVQSIQAFSASMSAITASYLQSR